MPVAVITGATGLIGQKLTIELLRRGYTIRAVTRNVDAARVSVPLPIDWTQWNPLTEPFPQRVLDGVDCVFHLAGEPVASRRWTPERKTAIRESRRISTQRLADAIRMSHTPPPVVVAASAIGYYSVDSQHDFLETDAPGSSFLSTVCSDWERPWRDLNIRTVIIRIGIVLDTDGGALAKLLPLFRIGLGSPIGNGTQWMSWIHISDLVDLFVVSAVNPTISGTLNGVSPTPVTNNQFCRSLGNALNRPIGFPIPRWIIRFAMGEMSDVVLSSQRVVPAAPLSYGFTFKYGSLDAALTDLLSPRGGKNSYRLFRYQWVPQSRSDVFQFFSNAHNLETITPPWLNFRIQSMTGPIDSGTIINYRLKIKGIPARWRTLISRWDPDYEFVDEMLIGPYTQWHHTHRFESIAGGTLLTDSVVYRMPFGILGDLAAAILVNRDIQSIFNYRMKVIREMFFKS